MSRRATAAVCAYLLMSVFAREAGAQAAEPEPAWRARFDLAGGAGWFNARPGGNGQDSWYDDALWYGVEGGYFWTEHAKLELGVSSATEGMTWSGETIADSSGRPISYVSSERRHRFTTVSAGVTYQFRRNAWVHPYLGAGVDVDRERVRTTSWVQPLSGGWGAYEPPSQQPAVETIETRGRLFGVGGAKVFFNERVFSRADLKVAGRSAIDKVSARFLVGADF